MSPLLLSVDDLTDQDLHDVLARSEQHRAGTARSDARRCVVGLVFLEASLRTRVGFAAAAHRLGWQPLDVLERRASGVSMPESWQDTLRTVSGYVDLLVVRPDRQLERAELAPAVTVPLLNAGDRGARAGHPSQALIDVFAMQHLRGPLGSLRIAICGDLRMRAVRSLLSLLARMPPAELVLVTADALAQGVQLPEELHARTTRAPLAAIGADVDVLYVAGIPHGAVGEDERTRLRVDRQVLARLHPDCVVLSPMPVIDEIASNARGDRRVRVFEQSDLGLHVRTALLEHLARAA